MNCSICHDPFEPKKFAGKNVKTCGKKKCKLELRRRRNKKVKEQTKLAVSVPSVVPGLNVTDEIAAVEHALLAEMPDDRALLYWSTDFFEEELERLTSRRDV